jgi:hypothetical protein
MRNIFKRPSKAKSIGSIVASICLMRGELAQAITDNEDDIISSQAAIDKAEEVKHVELNKSESKFTKIEDVESVAQTVAEENIKEAQAWLSELPSRAI